MKNLKEKYGNWALVTGASSGIGEGFANQLATLNFNLILVARRKPKLEKLSEKLMTQHNIETFIIDLDLTQSDFLAEIEKRIKHIDVGFLINNAGFAITGSFLTTR